MNDKMSAITALVLTGFVAYAGAWYVNAIDGNFAVLMLAAVLVTGVYWVAEKLYFLPQRRAAAQRLYTEHAAREATLAQQGIKLDHVDVGAAQDKLLMQPWWLDWTAGLFPVILVVFVLRSFLFEPFKIPSGSMIPTLRVGDLILVNKFHYGVRLPVVNTVLVPNKAVERGDVVVFRYPPQPSLDYIKRVVALPGDTVAYLNKQLTVNGQTVPKLEQPDFFDKDAVRYFKQYQEQAGGKTYLTLNDPDRPGFIPAAAQFAGADACQYSIEGVRCTVPQGHYFVMGDNRDNSLDSRYWGFVPDANLVGKAFFVWMNFGDFSRIGGF